MSGAGALLAHQGGWDEVLLILTPIAIFAALLGLANRRANAEVRTRSEAGSAEERAAGDPDPVPEPDHHDEGGPDHDGPPSGRDGGPAPPRADE